MIDLIGDIHGHADELVQLLTKLGYVNDSVGGYVHAERKVLFVGDYIDRGPKIRETLNIVKQMVESGNAIALMGNHEYNALCFHRNKLNGGHLRKHYIKNIIQHFETLRQFQNKQTEYEAMIEWFYTLPLYYETAQFRAVHACWDGKHIEYLKSRLTEGRLTDYLLVESAKKDTALHDAIEVVLKGKEITLADGCSFQDKDGTNRSEIRIKWWENPTGLKYSDVSVLKMDDMPDLPIRPDQVYEHYSENERPVFFGHYWLKDKVPTLYRDNICCLDYSVAKGGNLVAYSFDGELKLDARKLVIA